MIEIRNVTKRYNDALVINDVTLTIPKKGIVSIIGPNGAGKSTLLTMIARLIGFDSGSIHVEGLNICHAKGTDFAQKLSILRQENTLTARLTVLDLVSFGRYPYSKGRLNNKDRQFIESAIRYLGLEGLEQRFLDELSGGQRQRAFVAMVMAQDTDYVLLDEPLNNLDMKHSVAMMKQLRHAADTLDKTIIMVMHDINFASCYSDLIIALKEGHIIRQGSPQEIVSPETLKEIYDLDIKVEMIEGHPIAIYYK